MTKYRREARGFRLRPEASHGLGDVTPLRLRDERGRRRVARRSSGSTGRAAGAEYADEPALWRGGD